MSRKELPDQHKDILDECSGEALREHFERVVSKTKINNAWLSSENRYSIDTIERIKKDTTGDLEPDAAELNEYIAASILPHSLDAWSYFGRAVGVMLNGDLNTAKHLLYYSELRSALAILASQGIGVFDRKHFVINSIDSVLKISNVQTHDFAWKALDYWTTQLDAPNILLEKIYPEKNVNLDNWLQEFSIFDSTREDLIKKFLLEVGFDLKSYTEDHDARNLVSYRPTSLGELSVDSYQTILERIKQCWKLCEPSTSNSFKKLDELLLKKLLQVSFKGTHKYKKSYLQAHKQFADKLILMLENLGIGNLRKKYWKNYLLSTSSNDEVFSIIENNRDINSSNYIFGMLFRSLFLLRINSLLSKNCITSSRGASMGDLKFWTDRIIKNAGLANDIDTVSYFSDFWEDISDQLKDLDQWIEKEELDINHYNFQISNPISVPRFSSFERVCLWGVAS